MAVTLTHANLRFTALATTWRFWPLHKNLVFTVVKSSRQTRSRCLCFAPCPGCDAHCPASHQLPRRPRCHPGVLALCGCVPRGGGCSWCPSRGSQHALPLGPGNSFAQTVQVFSAKGAVQIGVSYFTSFHFISPSGNIWTLLSKATASHGNSWFCRNHIF